jgi:hypothetical protein
MMTPFKVVIILKGVTQGRQVISGAGTLLPAGLIEVAYIQTNQKDSIFPRAPEREFRNGGVRKGIFGKISLKFITHSSDISLKTQQVGGSKISAALRGRRVFGTGEHKCGAYSCFWPWRA